MSTWPPPPPPPRPLRLLPIALLLAALAGADQPAAAAAANAPGDVFTCFEKGWRAESPTEVARCIEAGGEARFHLKTYPLSGRAHSLTPAQARASLTSYFRKVSGLRIKDATPAKGPVNVRLYEYTYKPSGENARTMLLQVRLRRDEKRRWVLGSVTESAK